MSRLNPPPTVPSRPNLETVGHLDGTKNFDGLPAENTADHADFDQLFRQRYKEMVRLAIALVDDRVTAEEVVQDAFRKLWERLAEVQSPSAYLRVSVVNGCQTELRRRRVRRKHTRAERPESLDGEQHFLLDALAAVPIRRRTALVLRFYAQMSMAEIAETMDISVGTAKSMVSRGLDDLRKVIS